MVCDKTIYLLKECVKVKDAKGMIDFYTENDEVNALITKVKSILRVTEEDKPINKLPMNVIIAIAILLSIKDHIYLVTPEISLKDIVDKIDSAYVSNFNVTLYTTLKGVTNEKSK